MRLSGPDWNGVRRLIAVAPALLLLMLVWRPTVRADDGGPDWEPTPITGKVVRLFARQGDAIFAQSNEFLFRSDDAGTTWNVVPLPSPPPPWAPSDRVFRRIAIDPVHPATLYANGERGLYRSVEGGLTWASVLPPESVAWHPDLGRSAYQVIGLEAGAADPSLVYAGISKGDQFQFLRSADGAATWESVEEHFYTLCTWIMPVMQPHPTDPARVFRTVYCPEHGHVRESLYESLDRGETWTARFDVAREPYLRWAYIPKYLAGGYGAMPARFYLAADSQPRFQTDTLDGVTVFRSDDDAQTWTEILSSGQSVKNPPIQQPQVRMGGLAYDPQQPDTVYVALNNQRSPVARLNLGMGVRVSHDAGASWHDLGRPDIRAVNDLALSADGTSLYAATDQGVFRMRRVP